MTNDLVRPLSILLVEDTVADVHWMRLMLDEYNFTYTMIVAVNGEEAIDYLSGAEHPDLMLLDIDLPRVSGIQVLDAIRKNERGAGIPVCLVTGSELERDLVIERYTLDLRCYIVKPITPAAFGDALQTYPTLQPWAQVWSECTAGH